MKLFNLTKKLYCSISFYSNELKSLIKYIKYFYYLFQTQNKDYFRIT